MGATINECVGSFSSFCIFFSWRGLPTSFFTGMIALHTFLYKKVMPYNSYNKLESLTMKLKKILLLGLTAAVLAIPAFADETTPPVDSSSSDQQASTQSTHKKEAIKNNKKAEKKSNHQLATSIDA
jgi:hypothetical protein